jgi:hypothetical protein
MAVPDTPWREFSGKQIGFHIAEGERFYRRPKMK